MENDTGLATMVRSHLLELIDADAWCPHGAAMPSPVTPSGEFLIAHRMGLMTAYQAWLDSGVDFSLASDR